jgi:hypothetical protein
MTVSSAVTSCSCGRGCALMADDEASGVWYPAPDGDGLICGACFYSVGTFGNYGPVIQIGSGESGSGGDAGG